MSFGLEPTTPGEHADLLSAPETFRSSVLEVLHDLTGENSQSQRMGFIVDASKSLLDHNEASCDPDAHTDEFSAHSDLQGCRPCHECNL